MRSRRRRRRLLVGALACVAAVVALPREDGQATVRQAWTLHVALESDVQVDPALAPLYDSVADLTCLKLLSFTSARRPQDARLVPDAAVAFPRISHDGRTYVFTLRRGLRFSDGSPVTAANYRAGILRVLSPSMRSPNAQGIPDVTRVEARGRRLTITLKQPAGDFLARVAGFSFVCPVPTDLPVDATGVDLRAQAGPYAIARHDANRDLVLRRNAYYHGPRRARAAEIDFEIGSTGEQSVGDVEAGRLDATSDVPSELVPQLDRRYGLGRRQFLVAPLFETFFVGMNNERPLFRGNVRLRRAVNLALDRQALLRALGAPQGFRPTAQLLPPAMPGFRRSTAYAQRRPALVRARRLARAHLRGGRVVLVTGPGRAAAAQVVADELRRIGLRVSVDLVSVPLYLEELQSRRPPFDLVLTGWIADYPADPGNFLYTLPQSEPWMRVHGFRALAAANRLVGRARYRRFAALDVALMRDSAWVAPIANGVAYSLVARRIGCAAFAPADAEALDLGNLCLR
jgi:peptide/nickel transport system substrate-binding protein